MDREEAFRQLDVRLDNKNLVKHCLAVEAIMRSLAKHFSENEDVWGMAGLLHDIDLGRIGKDMSKHGLVAAEILESLGVDEAIIYAIKAHNNYNKLPRRRKLDKALYCTDPISGLITACALILPSKSLKDVDNSFVMRRFNEKGFARSVDREQIQTCEEIGLTLEEFIKISLEAMKGISEKLGL